PLNIWPFKRFKAKLDNSDDIVTYYGRLNDRMSRITALGGVRYRYSARSARRRRRIGSRSTGSPATILSIRKSRLVIRVRVPGIVERIGMCVRRHFGNGKHVALRTANRSEACGDTTKIARGKSAGYIAVHVVFAG